MATKQKIFDNLYLRTFGIGWGICCFVWAFMLFQFWWGNHDWPYIVQGVSVYSGLFEARYSQHLPFVFLFEGHLLPVFLVIASLAALVVEALFAARYLEVPENLKNYLFMALFVCLNPYNFVLFYFVHYMFALTFWGAAGIGMLLFTEKLQSWRKFLFGGLMFFLLLGSYPPNLALILCLFVAKRLKKYCDKKENFVQVCKSGALLGLQLISGFFVFKGCVIYLSAHSFLNPHMYNLELRSVSEVFFHIFSEAEFAVLQLFYQRSFMEWSYCILIVLLIVAALYVIYKNKVSKIMISVLLVAMFLASRFAFLVSGDSSGFAIFRMEYWGRLGIALFALGVLFNCKSKFIKNAVFFWSILCLYMFIKTDFDVQKVQYLGWVAHEKYQTRLKDNLTIQPQFDIDGKYIAVNFGYPQLRMKYYAGHVYTGEMVQYPHVFNESIVNVLFVENSKVPAVIGVEVKDVLVRHQTRGYTQKWADKSFWKNNPENMENIRFWLYNGARENSIYVDDKYIILVLDKREFYQKRELVASVLDE